MAELEFVAGPVVVRHIEPLYVTAIRYLPGSEKSVTAALRTAGVPDTPKPGQMLGHGPWALWHNPSEVILLSTARGVADAATTVLARDAMACAVDLSDGVLGLDLKGLQLDDLLCRLVDSHSIPVARGSATRARLADMTTTLVRQSSTQAWLLIDRSHAHCARSWLAHVGSMLT